MARTILLCGVSGSGKTTLARRLETRGFLRLTLDEYLWKRHGRSLATMPLEQQRAEAAKARQELKADMLSALSAGQDVVVDFPMCKREVRREFHTAAEAANSSPELWLLDPPLEVLKERLKNREFVDANSLPVSDLLIETFYHAFSRPGADENAKSIETEIDFLNCENTHYNGYQPYHHKRSESQQS